MRGHEPLIAMRLHGVRPESVGVSCDPLKADVWRNWPEYLDEPQIEIEAGDNVSHLDLRWAVNLPLLWVHGGDSTRVGSVVAALQAAGAKRVLAMVFKQRPWGPEMQTMQDTEGALTWQA